MKQLLSGPGNITSDGTSSTGTDVGAIVGGVAGGLATIGIVLTLIWFVLQRREHRYEEHTYELRSL